MKNKKILTYIGFILLCQLTGIIGSLFTTPAIPGWYAQLIKPSFSPPNWLFGPVWTTLYTLMGISVSIIWFSQKNPSRKKALKVFFIQLALNSLWSILFFGLKNPTLAFAEIIILWGFILYIIILFGKINKKASYLLIPYILWVTLASILNLAIAILN